MGSKRNILPLRRTSERNDGTDSKQIDASPGTQVRPATSAILLLGIGVLVHLFFLASLKWGWISSLFNDSAHRFGPGGDFFSIYAAGIEAFRGHSIYQIQGHVGYVPYAYPFRYAPAVGYTLAGLLSRLPAVKAYGLWLILCELTLLRNIRLTIEQTPDRSHGYRCAAMWLLFTPYFLELYVGQFTFITASLVFWAYLSWQEHAQTGVSGRKGDLFWALAFWLKMMPILFLPVALLRGRWKALLLAAVVLLGTSALYFLRFPQDWQIFVSTNGDASPFFHGGNQGLMSLIWALVQGNSARYLIVRKILIVLCAVGVLWLTFVGWKTRAAIGVAEAAGEDQEPARRQHERALLFLFVGCSALHPLLYKDVWEHHYVLLLAPLVLLALRRESRLLWLPPFLICALPTLFWFYDVRSLGSTDDPQNYWLQSISVLHHLQKPLAALWLMGGVVLAGFDLLLASARREQFAARMRRLFGAHGFSLVRATAVMAVCACLFVFVRWANASIQVQRSQRMAVTFEGSFLQQREETCGPAALAWICRHFGVETTEEDMAKLAGTTAAGTSMLRLQRAARTMGLQAEGWQVTLKDLARVPRPCLLFSQPNHFVILVAVRADGYYIADPAHGPCVWTAAQLERRWKGELLVFGAPGAIPLKQGHISP
jgi:predicted double-glycine peptidase